ncbi:MAG: ATPase [Rhodobacterales bacterium]|nr:ATPase [Rhodobacterales bacterium]NCT12259.1 ATPase [Rhodobacterales bacterium]
MSEWQIKRFWTLAAPVPADGGFGIALDGRPVRTPLRQPLVVPTRGLADLIAAEWQAQEGRVDPRTMPATRTANAAIDKVAPQRAEVVAMLAAYGGSDLMCYRAPGPAALVARQAAGWDPLLDWAAQSLGARLAVGTGVVPVAQDAAALARLTAQVDAMEPFALSAFHDLVSLSGSLVLALAFARGRIDAAGAWALSRIDEDWQVEQWGADDEATATAALKMAAFLGASRFYDLATATTPQV